MPIIACTNNRKDARQYQPYSNDRSIHWPVVRLTYNGGLTGLAGFLAKNIINSTRHRGSLTVTVYDGKTETDYLSGPDADAVRRAYDTDARAAHIPDYDFPLIGDNQTIEDYWNYVASDMIRIGAQMIRLRYMGWTEPRVYFVEEEKEGCLALGEVH